MSQASSQATTAAPGRELSVSWVAKSDEAEANADGKAEGKKPEGNASLPEGPDPGEA